MKKIGKVLLVLVAILVLGLTATSYIVCENTFPAWIVLGISIAVLVLLFLKKVRKVAVFGIVLLLVLANIGVFHLTNKMSLVGGISAKLVAPIFAQQIGQSFTLNREDTAEMNALDANAEWEVPEGYDYQKIDRDGYVIETLSPQGNDTGNVILQLHGGAFCRGINNSYRNLAVTFSEIGEGALVVTPDYTTSEKAPYPAALNDCIDTYQWILEQGYQPQNVILSGDSAGGNLVLAVTLYLRDHDMPLPAGIITMSPLTDHHFSSESCYEKAEECVLGSFFGNGKFDPDTFFYTDAEGIDLSDPYLSPAYGDYTGFPPMLMQVGTREILLDDTRVVAQKAELAGVDVTETEYYQMFHVFQTMGERKYKEADDAWKEIREFVEKVRNESEEKGR